MASTMMVDETIDLYAIHSVGDGTFYVTKNGVVLKNREDLVRYFSTRSSARKHITRERRGDYHR